MSTTKQIFNKNIILTWFTSFSGCLSLLSTDIRVTKGTNIGNPWLKGAYARGFCIKSANTEDTGIRSTCIRSTYVNKSIGIRNTFSTKGVYIKSTFDEVAYAQNMCAGSVSVIKHSKMYLQSF